MSRRRKTQSAPLDLRVSAGVFHHRRLETVPGARPAMERVREAVFSMLGPVVVGARVLDGFAGSGAYGIEALSRGASEAVFIDSDSGACDAIRRNLRLCGVEESQGRVVQADVFNSPGSLRESVFDLLFFDPPYETARKEGWLEKTLQVLEGSSMLGPNAWIIWEAEPELVFPDRAGWVVVRDRCYGRSRIYLFRRDDQA